LLASHSVVRTDHVDPTIGAPPIDSTPFTFDTRSFWKFSSSGVSRGRKVYRSVISSSPNICAHNLLNIQGDSGRIKSNSTVGRSRCEMPIKTIFS
ncbi:hypothetical protein B0H17DRAFT_957745, partial [Mycena rosella]